MAGFIGVLESEAVALDAEAARIERELHAANIDPAQRKVAYTTWVTPRAAAALAIRGAIAAIRRIPQGSVGRG